MLRTTISQSHGCGRGGAGNIAASPPHNKLRPDIQRLVDSSLARHPRCGTWRAWVSYHEFRERLSRTCGWHAKDHDQDQYDAAMAEWTRRAKL